jgi:outer membrane lipoprotein-sorting protein
MERLRIIILALLIAVASYGQTAKEVLDKAAAAVSNKSGITASFTLKGGQMNDKGTINIKGKKFQIMTPDVIIWFDGKTQWSYIRKNDEVNMSNPNESQLQALNPYNFINMYKTGFSYTMTKSSGSYRVHLTAKDAKRRVQEMFITIDQKSYHPTEVKLLQKSKWTTFTISHLKKDKLTDAQFRFNSKDFPSAEVIDLR